METVADKVDKDVKGIGVEVVDVRLKRVDSTRVRKHDRRVKRRSRDARVEGVAIGCCRGGCASRAWRSAAAEADARTARWSKGEIGGVHDRGGVLGWPEPMEQ